ncbi:MAG: hypothetical protein RIE53_02175 [Rhodothermales bacterium]
MRTLLPLLGLVVFLVGCEPTPEEREQTRRDIQRDVEQTVETSVSKIGAALEGIGQALQTDADVEVVDWRDFKDMIPGSLGAFDRVGWEGENTGALGIRISRIEGSYASDDGVTTMKLSVIDLGTIKSAAMKGLDLLDAEIDRENVEGLQKTREWNGHPGYIATDHHRAIGVAVVEDRFIVSAEIKGSHATPTALEEIFDDLPLRRLARMAR